MRNLIALVFVLLFDLSTHASRPVLNGHPTRAGMDQDGRERYMKFTLGEQISVDLTNGRTAQVLSQGRNGEIFQFCLQVTLRDTGQSPTTSFFSDCMRRKGADLSSREMDAVSNTANRFVLLSYYSENCQPGPTPTTEGSCTPDLLSVARGVLIEKSALIPNAASTQDRGNGSERIAQTPPGQRGSRSRSARRTNQESDQAARQNDSTSRSDFIRGRYQQAYTELGCPVDSSGIANCTPNSSPADAALRQISSDTAVIANNEDQSTGTGRQSIMDSVANELVRAEFRAFDQFVTDPTLAANIGPVLDSLARTCGDDSHFNPIVRSEVDRLKNLAQRASRDSNATQAFNNRYNNARNKARILQILDEEIEALAREFHDPSKPGPELVQDILAVMNSTGGMLIPCQTFIRRGLDHISSLYNSFINPPSCVIETDEHGIRRALKARPVISTTSALLAGLSRFERPVARALGMDTTSIISDRYEGIRPEREDRGNDRETATQGQRECTEKMERLAQVSAKRALLLAEAPELAHSDDENGTPTYQKMNAAIGGTENEELEAFKVGLQGQFSRLMGTEGLIGRVNDICDEPHENARRALSQPEKLQSLLTCSGEFPLEGDLSIRNPAMSISCADLRGRLGSVCSLARTMTAWTDYLDTNAAINSVGLEVGMTALDVGSCAMLGGSLVMAATRGAATAAGQGALAGTRAAVGEVARSTVETAVREATTRNLFYGIGAGASLAYAATEYGKFELREGIKQTTEQCARGDGEACAAIGSLIAQYERLQETDTATIVRTAALGAVIPMSIRGDLGTVRQQLQNLKNSYTTALNRLRNLSRRRPIPSAELQRLTVELNSLNDQIVEKRAQFVAGFRERHRNHGPIEIEYADGTKATKHITDLTDAEILAYFGDPARRQLEEGLAAATQIARGENRTPSTRAPSGLPDQRFTPADLAEGSARQEAARQHLSRNRGAIDGARRALGEDTPASAQVRTPEQQRAFEIEVANASERMRNRNIDLDTFQTEVRSIAKDGLPEGERRFARRAGVALDSQGRPRSPQDVIALAELRQLQRRFRDMGEEARFRQISDDALRACSSRAAR